MSLRKIDHVAIEIPDLDTFIDKLVGTGGLKLLRRGTATATGVRIAMLGDRMGTKLELIENPAAAGVTFLHVAFGTDDIEASIDEAKEKGWSVSRGPNPIPSAKAKSVFLAKDDIEFQVLEYEPDSPDLKTW